MSVVSTAVLAEIEWDEGLAMPVANADNKALENQVQKMQTLIVASQNELAETEDRILAMAEHLKNVRQELQHTQGLVTARGKEAGTEEHLFKIAQREEGRLKQEISRLIKEMDDLKEKKNNSENKIFKQNHKLEELKSQMKWDQQALEEWLEESARKDEDSMTIQKYTRQDEAKIQELCLRMEKLMYDALQKRRQLDLEVTNTMTSQIELDKTAEDFRHAHIQREELLSQWENTIEQMQKRDREIDILAAKLTTAKQEVRMNCETIHEKMQFFEHEQENNMEQEKKISVAERLSVRTRLDLSQAELQKTQFENETYTLKRTVDRTALELELARTAITHLKKDITEKTNKLHQARKVRGDLIEKLKGAVESNLSAKEQSIRMDDLFMAQERKLEDLRSYMKQLSEILYKKEKELNEAQTEQKMVEAAINGAHNVIKNLSSNINRLDTEALKQQEILYSQDFSLQQLERRCIRMQGEHNTEEKVILEAKITELQKTLEKKKQTHTLIACQIKKVEDDLRRVGRELEQIQDEKRDLTSKIEDLNLYNDNSEGDLKHVIHKKQNLMVDENLLKLKIKKLQDLINSKADNVLSMEKRKLQLTTAMKERQLEIKIHKDMLIAQSKATEEERQQISAELHERISKIDKMRKRYEILTVSMAPPEGEEEKSQAYYVIRAAQEKEELQREGDNLDARIRKAEKEIRALENTLKLMNGRNEQYRKSFNKITESSDEMDEKRHLDEQMRAVMDKYKYKRRQSQELQDDLDIMRTTMENLKKEEDSYETLLEEKKMKLIHLSKEVEDQRDKLDRVTKQNVLLSKKLRSARKTKEELPEERDFEVRELREFIKNVMKMVGDATTLFPEMVETVQLYFTQANIPQMSTPAAPSSSRSSLQGSARGSSISSSSKSSFNATPVNVGFDGTHSGVSSQRGRVSAEHKKSK